jgi:energy-coupling factor transport system permease protein
VTYRRRATPLHATRAGVGALWCTALAAAALAFDDPLVLGALAVALAGAAAGAGVPREVARGCLFTLPLALVVALVNPFVVRDGLTVLVRLGELPPLGQLDLTLEALVYGAVLGARLLLVVGCFALLAAAVDPDALLRAFRRVSFRSALAAALAVRLVPVLARDARRMADAQRCRGDGTGARGRRGRVAVLAAVTTSALDRALDVAATLEVRGYAAPSAARRVRSGEPWSRHDLAFAASAAAVVALTVAARIAGWASFEAYPALRVAATPATWGLVAALVLVVLLPFADRRGVRRA